MKIPTITARTLPLAAFVASSALAQVINPSFDAPTPSVPPGEAATATAVCEEPRGAVGESASKYWTLFGNTNRTSVNSWLATSPDGYLSNLVAVGGSEGGLVQVLAPHHTPTPFSRVGVWVYVLAGRAYVQIGDGGSGGGSVAASTSIGNWEYLSACGRPDGLNNEIIIYSAGAPAVFYADDATAYHDPGC